MGNIISFSGIDGAGKSTQVKLLTEYLRKKGKKVYVTEEMFGYFLLKPIIKSLRKATHSPSGGPVTRNTKALPKAWFIFAFIDIWVSYMLRTRKRIAEYDIVIADRYYTDIWANLLYYGYLPRWAFTPFVKLLPTPSIAFLFQIDPRNVRKREDDFPLSYYTQQAKIYGSLSQQIQVTIIEADGDKKQVFKKIVETLINRHLC